MNEWALEALRERGIKYNPDGTLEVKFHGDKYQKVKDLDAAIRQQDHIIEQQLEEQEENTAIGKLMKQFHEQVIALAKMTKEELTDDVVMKFMRKMTEILETMSRKREDLRREGYVKLINVYRMIEKNNIPAANVASQAALNRMRKRWLVNEKIIDKSYARAAALKNLKAQLSHETKQV